jgi:hypothetical protein
MTLVEVLSQADEVLYERFLEKTQNTLLFASLKYRDIVLKTLPNTSAPYFLAKDQSGEIAAALPTMMMETPHGNILNSLPYYGSNGGILGENVTPDIFSDLIDRFFSYAQENNCVSTTIITSPFEGNNGRYKKYFDSAYCYEDSRIGHLTKMPCMQNSQDIEDDLKVLVACKKTRNMVRKAIKSGVTVSAEAWYGDVDFLNKTHQDNMAVIGGLSKSADFFTTINEVFVRDRDYKIYTAWFEGKPIAALLLFYFKDTVEYFTPVIVAEYRSHQPLSLIIFQAMQEAVAQGDIKWWNWGGTWHSQEGVYRFKKSWGAQDMPYYYFTKLFDPTLLEKPAEYFLKTFPNFFVLPFTALMAQTSIRKAAS